MTIGTTDQRGGCAGSAQPPPQVLDDNDVVDQCLTENTRRLVRKLLDMGVEFTGQSATMYNRYTDRSREPLQTLFILRNHGQGMMNKAAGEAAPTWHLAANAAHRLGRVDSWSGGYPLLRYNGREYIGVNSHMPLTWIVRQPLEDWNLSRAEVSDALEVLVRDNPPHWKF